jgi:RNA polymerase sigma-70 factor (ECF subfamily)
MMNLKEAVVEVIPQLRRYALALTKDRSAADDLAQDVLLRAIERQGQFAQGTNLRAWLFTIMHNMFVDQVRRSRPFRSSVPLDECRLSLASSAAQEPWIELKELARAVDRLPLEQKATLLLVGLEGLTYEEAATVTGVAVGTVKSRVSRARETLRLETAAFGKEVRHDPAIEQYQIGGSERLRGRRACA